MSENKFFKLLCSLSVVLIVLYFIPFLGICLILFRYYVYRGNKYYKTPALLLVCGILLLIPKLIDSIIKILKLDNIEIPYLNSIITSDIYTKLLSYSKLLVTVGIIFLILSFIFRNVFNKLSNKVNSGIRNYMEQDLKKDYEIRKENDMKMQERREKAKILMLFIVNIVAQIICLLNKQVLSSFVEEKLNINKEGGIRYVLS